MESKRQHCTCQAKRTFLLEFSLHDIRITIDETVFRMAREDSAVERKKLLKEYIYYDRLAHVYEQHIENNEEDFSWGTFLKNGWNCLADMMLFKDQIVKEVGIERWEEAIRGEYKHMSEEKVKEHLKHFDETGDYYG